MGMITSSPLHNYSYQAELDFSLQRTLNIDFINKYIMEVLENKSLIEITDALKKKKKKPRKSFKNSNQANLESQI